MIFYEMNQSGVEDSLFGLVNLVKLTAAYPLALRLPVKVNFNYDVILEGWPIVFNTKKSRCS